MVCLEALFLAELYLYSTFFVCGNIFVYRLCILLGFLVCICMAVSGIVRQKVGSRTYPVFVLLFVHVITD